MGVLCVYYSINISKGQHVPFLFILYQIKWYYSGVWITTTTTSADYGNDDSGV